MGTMLYKVTDDADHYKSEQFYFYTDDQVLITINLDDHTRSVMAKSERASMLHQCQKPVDGMFVLARAILHYYHAEWTNSSITCVLSKAICVRATGSP